MYPELLPDGGRACFHPAEQPIEGARHVEGHPEECENLLITHPKVFDAAVFGVPTEDLGEGEGVVQAMPDIEAG